MQITLREWDLGAGFFDQPVDHVILLRIINEINFFISINKYNKTGIGNPRSYDSLIFQDFVT